MYVRQRWRVDTSEATRTDTGIDAAQRQPAKCVSDRWGFGRLAGPVHEPQHSRNIRVIMVTSLRTRHRAAPPSSLDFLRFLPSFPAVPELSWVRARFVFVLLPESAGLPSLLLAAVDASTPAGFMNPTDALGSVIGAGVDEAAVDAGIVSASEPDTETLDSGGSCRTPLPGILRTSIWTVSVLFVSDFVESGAWNPEIDVNRAGFFPGLPLPSSSGGSSS